MACTSISVTPAQPKKKISPWLIGGGLVTLITVVAVVRRSK